MGVPAFFRWLSRKYPSIVVHCLEEKIKNVDGVSVPVDTSMPNPNDVEFDNLYLDMNGIIHPCCHPENKPAPANEDEMMVDIFAYIDRIFSIVRPRKVLYMAIDGVAPRAKMNQQRSRRFRAAKESIEKREDIARIKEELRMKGANVPPDKPAGSHFDSNCITPGTPFMFRLAECLRYYIHDRLNNDPGWAGIKVILSDANVPGEGEHKIMDYIRRQRAQPDHDPNTHHCLCGADADLIMLGLATHEPHFTIIREEFKPNQPRPCEICAQIGHDMKECQGAPKEKEGEHDELNSLPPSEQEFIFLRLNVLREYLEKELQMTNLPFKQDMERAIDDWVFMCFFVGNDFLPHLPSLEIREGAIDRLVKLYKKAVYKTGGYLTDSGVVNLARVQLVMQDLGEVEDEIFKKRREDEQNFRHRNKMKRMRERQMKNAERPSFLLQGDFAPKALGQRDAVSGGVSSPRQAAYEQRMSNMGRGSNEDAAAQLRSMLKGGGNEQGTKRKIDEVEEDSDPEPEDEVKLWEDGWKDRYYESKFDVGSEDIEFRHTVANEYVRGLCWVLRYYYQGCASWKWYFPYHYAPFASDFLNIGDLPNDFEKNTQPFKPLEQLMGVFPAASKKFLPPTWQELMCEADSSIIDFYPTNFKIDLNGKKYAWQGVALLPFVDEKRLKKALEKVYPDLLPEEIARNVRGPDRLFVGGKHPAHDFMEALYENGGMTEAVTLDTSCTQGVLGEVKCDEFAVLQGQTVKTPLPGHLPDITKNNAICVQYQDPQFDQDFIFKATVLPGAKFPGKTLKPEDFEAMFRFTETNGRGGRGRGFRGGYRGRGGGNRGGGYRPQLGFQPHSGYRQQGSVDMGPAMRNIRHGLGPQQSFAPPESYSTSAGRQNRGGRDGGNSRNFYQSDNWNAQGGRQGGGNYNQSGYGQGYGQGGGYRREGQGGGGGGRGGGGGYGQGGGMGQGGYGGWMSGQRNQGQAYQQNQQRGYQQGNRDRGRDRDRPYQQHRDQRNYPGPPRRY